MLKFTVIYFCLKKKIPLTVLYLIEIILIIPLYSSVYSIKYREVNDLIENIQHKMLKMVESEITDNDFHYFWKYFVDDRKEIP